MKKLLLALAVVVAILAGLGQSDVRLPFGSGGNIRTLAPAGADTLAKAWREQRSGVQVQGEGVVSALLSDDNQGSRHQRFVLRLASGQTVLVAHNIDLAPRIQALREGDAVAFNGVYEWNAKGGVIHWTHHDPAGRHTAGWLRHAGQIYQ